MGEKSTVEGDSYRLKLWCAPTRSRQWSQRDAQRHSFQRLHAAREREGHSSRRPAVVVLAPCLSSFATTLSILLSLATIYCSSCTPLNLTFFGGSTWRLLCTQSEEMVVRGGRGQKTAALCLQLAPGAGQINVYQPLQWHLLPSRPYVVTLIVRVLII